MPIKTKFRTWTLTATLHTITGEKDNFLFKITDLSDFEDALRAGKAEVDKREGEQEWIEGYTNQFLIGEQK